MSKKISKEMMEHIGILAQLELSAAEKEKSRADMEQMLSCIDQLNELDTSGIDPMLHVFPIENVFREDTVTNADGRKELLCNAPQEKNGMLLVPNTLGQAVTF